MAHIRRKFFDVFASQGLAIAEETIRRIADLYAVEKQGRGKSPEARVALRQELAKPVFDELEEWLHAQLPKLSGKSPLAQAIRYALGRMPKSRPYLDRKDPRLNPHPGRAGPRFRPLAEPGMVPPAGTGSRTANGKIMKPIITLLCLSALAACSVDGSSGGRIPSGGSAGSLGPNYCHTVPSSLNERQRWNNLCFGK